MLTIVESPLFAKLWPDYWTEDERGEFCVFIAARPDAGNLVPDSGGCPAHVLRAIAKEMSDASS